MKHSGITRNIFKIIIFFIVGITGGIFADQILWPYFVERPLFLEYELEQRPIYLTERNEFFIQENTVLQEAIEKVDRVVVGIKTETVTKKILEGNGLVVTSDGLIVTLASLLPKNSDVTLYLDGKTVTPKIIQTRDNLTLLRLEGENLPTVGFGDFEKLKPGQRVFSVGVIFKESGPQKIVNEGVITYLEQDSSLIHTSIFENENLSGSALFDVQGNVLGLNIVGQDGEITTIPIFKIKEFLGF